MEYIYAEDMKDGIRYSFAVSTHTVVKTGSEYVYTSVLGETFTLMRPSKYSLVKEMK